MRDGTRPASCPYLNELRELYPVLGCRKSTNRKQFLSKLQKTMQSNYVPDEEFLGTCENSNSDPSKKRKTIEAHNQSVTVCLVRGLSLRFGAGCGSDKADKINGSGLTYRVDATIVRSSNSPAGFRQQFFCSSSLMPWRGAERDASIVNPATQVYRDHLTLAVNGQKS